MARFGKGKAQQARSWMPPRITDFWDQQQDAINAAARDLEAMPSSERPEALSEIAASVEWHCEALPHELHRQVAVPFVEDLYRAAIDIDRWDEHLGEYLDASAGTYTRWLSANHIRLQYLINNTWDDMSRPTDLFPRWFKAAGFVFACPQLISAMLTEASGSDGTAEARYLCNRIVEACHERNGHLVCLDVDSTPDSFALPLSKAGEAGVVTILRDEAPAPGTTVRVL